MKDKKSFIFDFICGIFFVICGILGIVGFIFAKQIDEDYFRWIPAFICSFIFVLLGIDGILNYKTNRGIIDRILSMNKYELMWLLGLFIIFIGIIISFLVSSFIGYIINSFGTIWSFIWLLIEEDKKPKKKIRKT